VSQSQRDEIVGTHDELIVQKGYFCVCGVRKVHRHLSLVLWGGSVVAFLCIHLTVNCDDDRRLRPPVNSPIRIDKHYVVANRCLVASARPVAELSAE